MNDTPATPSLPEAPALVARMLEVEDRLNGLVLGKPRLIRELLMGLLAKGHMLLEGLPGLGKTRLVRALSGLCDLESSRIQFTPDLMPLDIVGSHILSDREEVRNVRGLEFRPGPLFGNLILADEINRASPKTQSALLEAMAEQRVTVLGETRPLPHPFLVIATQNPIEMEGTYPLPEAQLDRFLFKLHVEDVSADVITELLIEHGRGDLPDLSPLLSRVALTNAMEAVERIALSRPVASYTARLVRATHASEGFDASRLVRHGASPRAAIAIAMAARARAFLEKRTTVGFEDIKAVALPALRHRIILDYNARLDGVSPDSVVSALLVSVQELERKAPATIMERI